MFEKLKFWKNKKSFKTKTITKKIISRKIKYPCENCLILPLGCYQLCDRVEMDNEKLRDLMLKAGSQDGDVHCPDCGNVTWYDGPRGGLSVNSKCGVCGHWFNLAPGLMGFERIHVDPETGKIYD